MIIDSVFRGVEVERAAFNHTSCSFSGFVVFPTLPIRFLRGLVRGLRTSGKFPRVALPRRICRACLLI